MGFRFRFPSAVGGHGKRKREVTAVQRGCGGGWIGGVEDRCGTTRGPACPGQRSADGEAVTVGGFDDKTGGGHGGETLVEGCGADAARCAQCGERPGLLAIGEGCGDALIDGLRLDAAPGLTICLDRLEGQSVVAFGQFKRQSGHGGGGAMLDSQDDAIVAVAAEIEVGVTPGVELRRSAQGLTGADGARPLSGMVDKRDGDGMAALYFAQEGEQRRDIAADVLVDAMQAHEGIEAEEARLQPGDSLIEPNAVRLEIEAQAGRGDHLDVEFGETDTGGGADAFKTATDDVQRVFGGIEQNAAGVADREAAQAEGTGGDGDGQIEGEEGFAAFGFAADDADGLFLPQPLDEPALLRGTIGEGPGWLNRKLAHRRRRIAALVSPEAGAAQISKNNVSSI